MRIAISEIETGEEREVVLSADETAFMDTADSVVVINHGYAVEFQEVQDTIIQH